MALSEKLATPPAPAQHGKPCSIGHLLRTLPDTEAAALQTMLADRTWSQQMIWEALRDEGYDAGRQSVNRHRGGRCRCVEDVAA